MKLNIYAIYDSQAKAFTQPFFLHTDGMAVRAFQQNINQEESTLSKSPQDYTLFRIAEFDDSDGNIKAVSPENLGIGSKYVEKKVDRDQLELMLEKVLDKLGD